MTGAKYILTTLYLGLALIFSAAAVSGEENPPQSLPGGFYETAGDWTIEDGDVVNWSAATITVNGNLTVESGGVLEMDNVELIINSTVDGGFGIEVREGGVLRMTDGLITSVNPHLHYNMTLDGEVYMRGVQVSEVWGDPEEYWRHGIAVNSDDTTLEECSFMNNNGAVLHIYSSDPTITGCRFYNNQGMAAVYEGRSGGLFKGNRIYRQPFGMFVLYYASPLIENNSIYQLQDIGITFNGIMSPRAVNNTIRDCPLGMLFWYSNAVLDGNLIYDCETGMQIMVDSEPRITSCTVRNNLMTGVVMNGSSAIVSDTVITGNSYDGLRMLNDSNLEVTGSVLSDNSDEGLQITDSFAKMSDTVMEGNSGDTIYARGGSSVELFRVDIDGEPDADERELRMENGSEIEAYDSTFDGSSVSFGDAACRLTVNRKVQFSVKDPDHRRLSDVLLRLINETGTDRTIRTNADGLAYRYLELYQQSDLTGDADGVDPGELIQHGYDLSIEHEGFLPYSSEVVMDIDHLHEIVLRPEPEVHVIFNNPGDGESGVDVGSSVLIRFDKDVDPDTIELDIQGPGGSPLFYDVEYLDRNRTARIRFTEDLEFSSRYTIVLKDVKGTREEVFHGPFTFSFSTESEPLPDNDRDGIPDEVDDDDDNDGFKDSVELFYGTDPFDPMDHPEIPEEDKEEDPPDDVDPIPPDINITPIDDDENILPSPIHDDDLEPVTRTENSTSTDDGESSLLLLVVSGSVGLLILAGTIVMIFVSGRRRNPLKDDEL